MTITPNTFRAWLEAMRGAGLIRHERDAGRLLGVSPTSVVSMKRDGVHGHAATRTALAMRALLHRLEPYEVTK